MVLASLRSRLSYYDRRRAARLVPRRALPANATAPTPGRSRRTPDAPAGDGYMALRPTLRADLSTINS
jgi:hypothetical protein